MTLEVLTRKSTKKDHIGYQKPFPRLNLCHDMNERITEDIVREHFKTDSMFKNIKLEEQRTQNKRIKELLKNASKKGTGNIRIYWKLVDPKGNVSKVATVLSVIGLTETDR